MSSQTLGTSLRATVEAVRRLVAAMHAGEIKGFLPTTLRPERLFWTPSYVQGRQPEYFDSMPYTAASLSMLLGNNRERKAHDIVRLALLLLELHELGAVSEQDLQAIYNGSDGFTQHLLHKILVRTKSVLYDDFAIDLAAEILSVNALVP